MELIDILNKRYSTKKFDPNKKINEKDMNQIIELLRLSASSTNLQPWHFLIAKSDNAKQKILKSVQGFYSFNEKKIIDCSHVIIFCSKTDVDDKYLKDILDKEEVDGRFTNPDFKTRANDTRKTFIKLHREANDLQEWFDKQVYLNLGSFLLGLGILGIDGLPIEGFDPRVIDDEFDLKKQGYKSLVMVAIGYHLDEDFNLKLPKSRLDKKMIIKEI